MENTMRFINLKETSNVHMHYHLKEHVIDIVYLNDDFFNTSPVKFRENIYSSNDNGDINLLLSLPRYYRDEFLLDSMYSTIDILLFKASNRRYKHVRPRESEYAHMKKLDINESGIRFVYSDEMFVAETQYANIDFVHKNVAGIWWIDLLKINGYDVVINGIKQ